MRAFDRRDLGMFALIVLAGVVAFFAIGARGEASEAMERAETAEDSVLVMRDRLTIEMRRADAAEELAVAQDTAVAEVVEATDAVIEEAEEIASEAEEVFASAVDSLKARIDTTGLRLLGQVVESHEVTREQDVVRYRALEVRLGAVERSRALWRTTSQGQGGVIESQAAIMAEQAIAIEGYKRVANPSMFERIAGAIPTLGGGVAAGIVLVFVLARSP